MGEEVGVVGGYISAVGLDGGGIWRLFAKHKYMENHIIYIDLNYD